VGLAGWVFPGREVKLMHNTTLRGSMATCRKAAGVEHRFSVHGFRRTFNNLLRQVTEHKVVVRSMTGHSAEEVTEHDSHAADRRETRRARGDGRLGPPRSVGIGMEVGTSVGTR
jgi:integrase